MMDDEFETFATPGIDTPAAFADLRRAAHDAAGPHRIAASRTRDTVSQLRARADYMRDALYLHSGTGLGDWYATLSTRLERLANEIEGEAIAEGVIQ